MTETEEILRQIGQALEAHGYVHMTNGRDIGTLLDTLEHTQEALRLAVDMLAPLEPPDSRAVSDEFVALASVVTGDDTCEVMGVIRAANARSRDGQEAKR